MSKKIFKLFYVFIFYVVVSGCAASRINIPKYEVKAYLQDKPRVDQEISGNAGYLVGKPKKDVNINRKRTRKIFVVEVTERDTVSPYLIDMDAASQRKTKKVTNNNVVSSKNNKKHQSKVIPVYPSQIQIPSFDDDMDETNTEEKRQVSLSTNNIGKVVNYKVEKDDTLQKISKKFYGCYSKWPRIYKANKSQIKDPNFLKPGIILKIPMD